MAKQSDNASWKPTASMQALRHRAQAIDKLRDFFRSRKVLEVSTPLLTRHTVTDATIESFVVSQAVSQARFPSQKDHKQAIADASSPLGYLQTSPEYMMKRLLAAGSGPIYQFCKAFRDDEHGALHRCEFTMLEWYRPGFNHHQLMDEVDDLLIEFLSTAKAKRYRYAELFQHYLQVDVFDDDIARLESVALQHQLPDLPRLAARHRDTLLQLLMSHLIEPRLNTDFGARQPVFVDEFPSSQAALSKIIPSTDDARHRVAARFEVYYQGVELANGFDELQDAQEQRQRFRKQQLMRQQAEQAAIDIDEHFLAALEHGLPACSGVAFGFDRLLMLHLGASSLSEVMAFADF